MQGNDWVRIMMWGYILFHLRSIIIWYHDHRTPTPSMLNSHIHIMETAMASPAGEAAPSCPRRCRPSSLRVVEAL
jgi:hypothetical protein